MKASFQGKRVQRVKFNLAHARLLFNGHFVRCAIELFTVKQRVTSGQLLSQQEVVQEVGEPRHFGVIEPIRVRGWWPAWGRGGIEGWPLQNGCEPFSRQRGDGKLAFWRNVSNKIFFKLDSLLFWSIKIYYLQQKPSVLLFINNIISFWLLYFL